MIVGSQCLFNYYSPGERQTISFLRPSAAFFGLVKFVTITFRSTSIPRLILGHPVWLWTRQVSDDGLIELSSIAKHREIGGFYINKTSANLAALEELKRFTFSNFCTWWGFRENFRFLSQVICILNESERVISRLTVNWRYFKRKVSWAGD